MPAALLHPHAALAGLVLFASSSAPAKKSTGSPAFLILIVILLGVYLLWLRPQRKRQQASAAALRQAEVGDEVVTAAGIYGRVISFDGDRAAVEIAPGTTIEVARRALGQRVDPVTPMDAPEDEDTGTGFGHPGYDGHDDLDSHPVHDDPDDLDDTDDTDGTESHPRPSTTSADATDDDDAEPDGDEHAPGGST